MKNHTNRMCQPLFLFFFWETFPLLFRDRGVFPIELSLKGANEIRRTSGGALADRDLGTQARFAHRADEDDG